LTRSSNRVREERGLRGSPRHDPAHMPTESPVGIGDRVCFRIADVYLPEPAEVLARLTLDVEANGVVVEFSDSGSSPRAYALVRITAYQSVLLPIAALRSASARPPAANGESAS